MVKATPEQVARYLQGASPAELAAAAGVSRRTMRDRLKAAGVKSRPVGKARVLARAAGRVWTSAQMTIWGTKGARRP